jgi:hypothetical protein
MCLSSKPNGASDRGYEEAYGAGREHELREHELGQEHIKGVHNQELIAFGCSRC